MTDDTTPTSSFHDFGLHPTLAAGLAALGLNEPTPIQVHAIPPLIDGRDVVGRARTGSGKTAAFGLPLLHRVGPAAGAVRGLVLAPTRELALQVAEAVRNLGAGLGVKVAAIYGGAPYGPQLKALDAGVPIVVGTPGRVIDHLERGSLDLSKVEMLVLDEADEMLRMGFFEDVNRIFEATPSGRQVALFSATMPDPIRKLADAHLKSPVEVQVERGELTVDHIHQTWMKVPARHKLEALVRVLQSTPPGATLIFSRTRQSTAEVADALQQIGVGVEPLHGDLDQRARERVLQKLRSDQIRVVVATDVAARGLDIDHITQIINFDLPHDTETYVHRIGRTGRAGREGHALTFVTSGERRHLKTMMQQLKFRIEEVAVPSAADIARLQQQRLEGTLREQLDDAAGDARAFVEGLVASGWSAEDLAAAAIRIVASRQGIPLAAVPDEPEPQVREEVEADPSEPIVELFLPIGSGRGIRAGDIVGALANEAGVPSALIGKVTIALRKSFVGVPLSVGRYLVDEHRMLILRGHEVPIMPSRNEPGSAPPPRRPSSQDDRPPRKPYRKGPPRR